MDSAPRIQHYVPLKEQLVTIDLVRLHSTAIAAVGSVTIVPENRCSKSKLDLTITAYPLPSQAWFPSKALWAIEEAPVAVRVIYNPPPVENNNQYILLHWP